ncbi:hypothetical protein [Aquimarina sediminis]|nr:hypothetical protein [Aquimarina sediminis]
MNSKKLNLQELSVAELNETNGGGLIPALALTVAIGSFFFNAGYQYAAAQ